MAANPSIEDSGEWVLVPREPTANMMAVGDGLRYSGAANYGSGDIYAAMLSAAPERPAALREQVYDAVYPVLDELATPAPWTRTLGGMTAAIADAVMSLLTLSASPPSPPAVWSGEDNSSISQSGYDAPMGASAGAALSAADGLTIADYEEAFADHQRLVRELDVLNFCRETARTTLLRAGALKPERKNDD